MPAETFETFSFSSSPFRLSRLCLSLAVCRETPKTNPTPIPSLDHPPTNLGFSTRQLDNPGSGNYLKFSTGPRAEHRTRSGIPFVFAVIYFCFFPPSLHFTPIFTSAPFSMDFYLRLSIHSPPFSFVLFLRKERSNLEISSFKRPCAFPRRGGRQEKYFSRDIFRGERIYAVAP